MIFRVREMGNANETKKPGNSQVRPDDKVKGLLMDNEIKKLLGRGGMKYVETEVFIQPINGIDFGIDVGYKLHVNVSKDYFMDFLEKAVGIFSENNTSFKIWKPSAFDREIGVQQGKDITIYTQSRSEAIRIISELSRVLGKYPPGKAPPNEEKITEYISTRVANYNDSPLINPWNPNDIISGLQSRLGDKKAGWFRGLKERAKLVSRSDVLNGKAEIGDIVALLDTDGKYRPAELVNYIPENGEVYLKHLIGTEAGRIDKKGVENLSREPGNKSMELSVLEKVLNGKSRVVSRFDIINGKSRPGDIVVVSMEDGYWPAAITEYDQDYNLTLVPLGGEKEGKSVVVEINNITRAPAEKIGMEFMKDLWLND